MIVWIVLFMYCLLLETRGKYPTTQLCYVQIPLGTFDVHAKSIKMHANQHLARLGMCMLSKVC
jgi:hypothetical protein